MAAKIFAIGYLAGIRASGDHWPLAVLIPGLPLAMAYIGHVRDKRKASRDLPPNV